MECFTEQIFFDKIKCTSCPLNKVHIWTVMTVRLCRSPIKCGHQSPDTMQETINSSSSSETFLVKDLHFAANTCLNFHKIYRSFTRKLCHNFAWCRNPLCTSHPSNQKGLAAAPRLPICAYAEYTLNSKADLLSWQCHFHHYFHSNRPLIYSWVKLVGLSTYISIGHGASLPPGAPPKRMATEEQPSTSPYPDTSSLLSSSPSPLPMLLSLKDSFTLSFHLPTGLPLLFRP